MSLKDVFRRVLRPEPTSLRLSEPTSLGQSEPTSLRPPEEPRRPAQDKREAAAAWMDAFERGLLNPPRDVHDPQKWNTYWTNQITAGPMEQAFSDMMSSDCDLLALLTGRHVRTILCAGNGLSSEPVALALYGFHVTALDISAIACQALGDIVRRRDGALTSIPGFRINGDTVVFGDVGPIPPDVLPPIHRAASVQPQAGGSLTFVVGDLALPEICPGPFDAVIERRTVQLFPEGERALAVDRLVSRLGASGFFLSHHHDGCGRPGETRHYADRLVPAHGFVLDRNADLQTRHSAPRLARLFLSTG